MRNFIFCLLFTSLVSASPTLANSESGLMPTIRQIALSTLRPMEKVDAIQNLLSKTSDAAFNEKTEYCANTNTLPNDKAEACILYDMANRRLQAKNRDSEKTATMNALMQDDLQFALSYQKITGAPIDSILSQENVDRVVILYTLALRELQQAREAEPSNPGIWYYISPISQKLIHYKTLASKANEQNAEEILATYYTFKATQE